MPDKPDKKLPQDSQAVLAVADPPVDSLEIPPVDLSDILGLQTVTPPGPDPDDDSDDDDPDDDDAPDDDGIEIPAGPAPQVSSGIPETPASFGAQMAAQMDRWMSMMAEREDRILRLVDEKVASIRAPEVNGTGHLPGTTSAAELAATPGRYPEAMTAPSALRSQTGARMVAFIPKEDPFNPRQTTFRTWINGRELRSKRGQVMILTPGHGIDLARNGHGNCVDIAAMQGIGTMEPLAVPQQPNYARPDNWNGMPLDQRSSFVPGRML